MVFQINKNVFSSFPYLTSSRLVYRNITPDDSESLYIIRTNEVVMRYMDTHAMKSLSEAEKLVKSIRESFKSGTGINWGIEEKSSKTLLGYFGFWRIEENHCRGEVGYALHPDSWGKGYMQEAMKTLVRFGFKHLNLHSIEANVNPENINSMKLLEKIGFKKEAFFRENFLFNGEFKDSIIYSLLERYNPKP